MTEGTPMVEEKTPGPRTRKVGPFVVTRAESVPRTQGRLDITRMVSIVGIAVTLIHEFTYRESGGDDYQYGVISHAGADLLLLLITILTVTFLMERRR